MLKHGFRFLIPHSHYWDTNQISIYHVALPIVFSAPLALMNLADCSSFLQLTVYIFICVVYIFF